MAEGRGNHKNSDKRRRILDAAVAVFAEKGFFQARVSDIARLAGVADGTIYLYFKNKDDLLISIFEEKMKEINVKFREALASEAEPLARFRKLIAMHLAGFQAYPDLAAVLQVELRQSSRFMREYKKVELKNYLDLMGDVVREGQQQGVFRKDVPLGLVKRFIFGALDEVVSTWVLAGRPYDLESLTEPLMDLFLNGLRDFSADVPFRDLSAKSAETTDGTHPRKGGQAHEAAGG